MEGGREERRLGRYKDTRSEGGRREERLEKVAKNRRYGGKNDEREEKQKEGKEGRKDGRIRKKGGGKKREATVIVTHKDNSKLITEVVVY